MLLDSEVVRKSCRALTVRLFYLAGRVRTAAKQLLSLHHLSVLLAVGSIPVPLFKLYQLYDGVLPTQALQCHL